MTWALNTVISLRRRDPYTEHIAPLTEPLLLDYADRHGLTYAPTYVIDEDTHWMRGTRADALGTCVVYSGWPHRSALLDTFEGFVYVDIDAVIVDPERNILLEVDDDQPVGMQQGLTGALMVVKANDFTRQMMQHVWDVREEYKHKQWAEEGAIKDYFGYDSKWEHGEPAAFLGPTEHTPRLRLLAHALKHPLDPTHLGTFFAMNPGGIHPLSRRIDFIRQAIEERRALHTSRYP